MEESLVYDYKKQDNLAETFCDGYLQHYYDNQIIGEDEAACFDFIRDVVFPRLSGTESLLELGCGPTVHHAIMLAEKVSSMHLADYLEDNIAAVENWKSKTPKAWDWSKFASFCLSRCDRKSTPEAVQEREDLTREKIQRISTCNLFDEYPLPEKNLQYDVVSAFYCTEVLSSAIETWRQVMHSLGRLTKKEGFVLIVGLYGTNEWRHFDDSGNPHIIPVTCIDDQILFATLDEMGFEVPEGGFQRHVFPNLLEDYMQGVYFLFAKKKKLPE